MADYAADATLFTPSGVFTGTEAIQGFFTAMMGGLPDSFMESFSLDAQEVDGEYAYIAWNAGDAAPLGTDTFHVVDGKIIMQSFAAYMPS